MPAVGNRGDSDQRARARAEQRVAGGVGEIGRAAQDVVSFASLAAGQMYRSVGAAYCRPLLAEAGAVGAPARLTCRLLREVVFAQGELGTNQELPPVSRVEVEETAGLVAI